MFRKKAEETIYKWIDRLVPGSPNVQFYKDYFSKLNDKEFDVFMKDLKSGKRFLTIQIPNWSKAKYSVKQLLTVADDLNHNFFERIWITDESNGVTYLTPTTNMVIDLPVRRFSQLLTKKISVPEDHRVVNALTGQATGDSKGARVSKPELEIMSAMGAEQTCIEFLKYRGGDLRGRSAFNAMLSSFGNVSLAALTPYASGVESTKTLRTIFNCAHLKVEL